VPQEFTVTLTDEQAEALRQLAAHWRETLEEALRRVVKEGIDIEMMEKANDEQQANPRPRQYGPSGDLDDDIPF
jgi:dsDNA-binding SOS-regulon protein